jgi:uncharacterized protein YbjT (DUF2867 family)
MKALVTGATGNVGANAVRALRERGVPVRAFVRDGDRAAHMLGEDVELAVGDFGNREALERALWGTQRLFLACGNAPGQVEWECAAIDAAAAAGVDHVVKLSGPAPAIASPLVFDHWHGQIEAHLQRSGLAWVLLRPSAYMTNLLQHAATVEHQDALFAPAGAARISFVDPRDVGEAAAAALAGDDHAGRAYALTGPEAMTFKQIAQDLSLVVGRSIAYVDVPYDVAREGMHDAGVPPFVADAVVALFRAQRAGMMERTTDGVQALTGRPPRSFSRFAHDHAAHFGAGALAAS